MTDLAVVRRAFAEKLAAERGIQSRRAEDESCWMHHDGGCLSRLALEAE